MAGEVSVISESATAVATDSRFALADAGLEVIDSDVNDAAPRSMGRTVDISVSNAKALHAATAAFEEISGAMEEMSQRAHNLATIATGLQQAVARFSGDAEDGTVDVVDLKTHVRWTPPFPTSKIA